MKISLSTKPKDIIATLSVEWQMAIDAYIAHKGGAEALDRWQDTLLGKAAREEKGFIADHYLWVSPDGNKWCIFQDVIYDKASTYRHTCEYAFSYYETIPYAGIFFLIHTFDAEGKKIDGVVIYESHIFERLSERGIMKWEGMKTLMEFISKNHGNGVYCTDPEKWQFDTRLNGGVIARGHGDKGTQAFFRMHTVLADEQLTTRQRKGTAAGRRWGDSLNKTIDLPYEDVVLRNRGRIAKAELEGNLDAVIHEQLADFARTMHMSYEDAELLFTHFRWTNYILWRIKPSLEGKIDADLQKAALEGAMKLKKEWETNHDEESYRKATIDTILEVSRQCNLHIMKPSVIRTIYQMMKGKAT